jgi:hypothetical protein
MYGEGPSQWEETKGTRNAVLEPWSSVLKPGLDLSSLRGTLASLGIFLPFLSSLCSMCSPWHSHGDDFQVGCPCLVCHTQPLQQDKSWKNSDSELLITISPYKMRQKGICLLHHYYFLDTFPFFFLFHSNLTAIHQFSEHLYFTIPLLQYVYKYTMGHPTGDLIYWWIV